MKRSDTGEAADADSEFRWALRTAIAEWDRAVAHAEVIEDELWSAAYEERYHPHWEALRLAHERLTHLGKQCLTPEQDAMNPITHCPYGQLELLKPKAGAA